MTQSKLAVTEPKTNKNSKHTHKAYYPVPSGHKITLFGDYRSRPQTNQELVKDALMQQEIEEDVRNSLFQLD